MSRIQELLTIISDTEGCKVIPPSISTDFQMFELKHDEKLPGDLREFLSLTSGVQLYSAKNYSLYVHGIIDLKRANPVIVGEPCEYDRSYYWFILAKDANGGHITIDLSTQTNGRCYDSFWDCHGVPGSCAIVATSFTDFLERALKNQGEYWWWLQDSFVSLGDAYDG